MGVIVKLLAVPLGLGLVRNHGRFWVGQTGSERTLWKGGR